MVGLPGFIATRPKWILPERCRSMSGLSRSDSPILVPPVVMIRSASARPFCKAESVASTSSETMPRSIRGNPRPAIAACKPGRLESKTLNPHDSPPASAEGVVGERSSSSFPVLRIAILGCGRPKRYVFEESQSTDLATQRCDRSAFA